MPIMVSKTLKEVLERVETWPEHRQEDAADLLIEMERQDAYSISLSDSQEREVERRLAKPHKIFVTLDEARKRVALRHS
jgi:hypothetical protein